MALEVLITTPEGLIHRGEAAKVVVPAHDGELGILPRHAPLIAELGVGELRVTHPREAGAPLSFFIDGGFVQVLRDRVTVLATRAEPLAAVDPAKAEEELRALLAEPQAAGAGAEARAARTGKVQAAKKRAALARKKRAAG